MATLEGFTNAVAKRRAIGLIVAETIDDEARLLCSEKGIHSLSRTELMAVVSRWDPMKQRIAAQSYLYYASHVEQNAALAARVKCFFDEVTQSH